jgi:hypothetical protein
MATTSRSASIRVVPERSTVAVRVTVLIPGFENRMTYSPGGRPRAT